MHLRVASLGFGNVGRALAAMLAEKEAPLRERYDLTLAFTGALTRSAGGWVAPEGVSAAALAASGWPAGAPPAGTQTFAGDTLDFAAQAPADVLLELTTLNPQTGQPALDHVRAALAAGRHVVTANKGPIAYGYRELRAQAATRGVALRFESTVMDGTPIFSMAEASLPATAIAGFTGLLNATSNYVLSRMAAGATLEEAVAGAQAVGIAEANPNNDLEGWDASVKATVLANVLMGTDLRPGDIVREGLGAEAMRQAQAALPAGHALKQLVTVTRAGGALRAYVRLVALPPDDAFAHVGTGETAVRLHTDTMRDLTIIEGDGDPGQTAFGIVADLVNIARGRWDV
ncbi:MAG: homoserine dehydrogenase [Ktedonobacterales bacterium]